MAEVYLARLLKHYSDKEAALRIQVESLARELTNNAGVVQITETSALIPQVAKDRIGFEKLLAAANDLIKEGYSLGSPEEVAQVLSSLIIRPESQVPSTQTEVARDDKEEKIRTAKTKSNRKELSFDGQTANLKGKRQFPMARYLYEHLREKVDKDDLLLGFDFDLANQKKAMEALYTDISEIRRDLKAANVPLEILSVKGGYIMVFKGEKPEGVQVSNETSPAEVLTSLSDAASKLAIESWTEKRILYQVEHSKVLKEGVHYKRVGMLRKRMLTEEGMRLFELAAEKMENISRLRSDNFDRIVSGTTQVKKQEFVKKPKSTEKYSYAQAAEKLNFKATTLETLSEVEGLFMENVHFIRERHGRNEYFYFTKAGLERARFIDTAVKGALARGERIHGKTALNAVKEWFSDRKPKRASVIPKGEQAWGLIKPFTVQEEVKLGYMMMTASKDLLKSFDVVFSPAALEDAAANLERHNKIADPGEVTRNIEKKLLSLSQNPAAARNSKFGNPENYKYHCLVVDDLLIALENIEKSERGKAGAREFIHKLLYPQVNVKGTFHDGVITRIEILDS